MKLEYLPEGSPECPLIRLFEFNRSEVQELRQLLKALVTGDRQDVALNNEMWLESVGNCHLNLRVGKRNEGIRQVEPFRFECVFTSMEWGNLEVLLEPFSESDISGFQWLTTGGSVALLISRSGRW
jgi:hypothetical protein